MKEFVAILLACAVLSLLCLLPLQLSNAITVPAALERFYEIAGTRDIEIVRHSNPTPIFGDPHDVTFELLVEERPVSGRCTSEIFSPMICRLYDGE